MSPYHPECALPLVLLSDAYLSPLLIRTLIDEDIPVFSRPEYWPVLNPNLRRITLEDAQHAIDDPETPVYFNAEDCLRFIEQQSNNKELRENVRFFKDKAAFKRRYMDGNPTATVLELNRNELATFVPPADRSLIVKPSIGFHSLGVRRFCGHDEWQQAVKEIVAEVEAFSSVFDEDVVNSDRFLVEDYIEGDEITCDAYFDPAGEPVILSITCHPFADRDDTRDLVYYTSRDLVAEHLDSLRGFLDRVGSMRPLRNFPLHAEVRIQNGRLTPIEINPLRFGGFGLADLPHHAFDINAYAMYLKNQRPDWGTILGEPDNAYYAFIVGQTPSRFDPARDRIDEDAYRATFREILEYAPIDPARYKFFSTVFAKSRSLDELTHYLTLDFDRFRLDRS